MSMKDYETIDRELLTFVTYKQIETQFEKIPWIKNPFV